MARSAGSMERRARGRGNRSGDATLLVRARTKRGRVDWFRTVGGVLVVTAAAVALAVGLWLGAGTAGAVLYSANDAFTIRSLRFTPDDSVVRDYFRLKFGIAEGANLFAFDIARARAEFLRQSPNYREVEVTRLLPGTVAIALHEREPLARFGRGAGFIIDREGVVFGPRTKYGVLPAVVGYTERELKPGDRVTGPALDAALLLDACNTPDFAPELTVRSVDLRGNFRGRKDDLRMYLEGDTTVDIWWKRAPKDPGSVELKKRLLVLRSMLRQARLAEQRLKSVNLTLDNFEQGTPFETWQ